MRPLLSVFPPNLVTRQLQLPEDLLRRHHRRVEKVGWAGMLLGRDPAQQRPRPAGRPRRIVMVVLMVGCLPPCDPSSGRTHQPMAGVPRGRQGGRAASGVGLCQGEKRELPKRPDCHDDRK